MSYAIVFSSKTGNTALLAQTLQEQLPQADCCYFGAPDAAALAADTLYVGFWTDKGKADADTLDFLKQLRGKRVFLFGTAGFGGSAPYFEKKPRAALLPSAPKRSLPPPGRRWTGAIPSSAALCVRAKCRYPSGSVTRP